MHKINFRTIQATCLSLGLMITSAAAAAPDVCDNLQLTIDNQLSSRYNLEIRSIVYKNGEGNGNLHAGSNAAYDEKLTEIMHPGFTLWGLLHGTIQTKILINVVDNKAVNSFPYGTAVVNRFELKLAAHGSGKLKGLCIIETNLDVQYLDLPDARKGLITVKKTAQGDTLAPQVTMHVWKLAK